MDVRNVDDQGAAGQPTQVERRGDRELVATRILNGPARFAFRAFTDAELFKRWWLPEAFAPLLQSITLDVRPGGGYKLVFQMEGAEPMAFFGRYLEVVADTRIVWTNEESGDAGQVSTVTFEEKDGRTRVIMSDLYPSKAALDEALESGSTSGSGEALDRLNDMVVTLAANG